MKKLGLLTTAFAIGLAACGTTGSTGAPIAAPASATPAPSDAAFLASVARLASAWDAGDGAAWGAEFWPDGSLINILGVVFPNEPAVAAVTSRILAGPFKGSTFAPTVERIRFLGADAAVVDTDIAVTNYAFLPPGSVATQPGLLLTRLTLVFERRLGIWKIEAAQNTSVLPPPASPAPIPTST